MTSLFSEYVKPHLGKMLSCMGLDVEFARAEGNTLYYLDESGCERPVLDMIGGYGSLIFGHNHPDIVNRAKQLLDAGTPVHAQFSLRGEAGKVGEALNAILRREIAAEEPYLVTFANSGAEAVEAAIKHAELDRLLKLADLLDTINVNIETVRTALRRGEAEIPENIYDFSDIREQVFDVRSFEDLIVGLINYNSIQLAKRPVFLALERSFHGKLIGSVQLTYNKNFRRPFQYFGLKTRFVSMNRPEMLEQIVQDERLVLFDLAVVDGQVRIVERELPIFSAFILEPIQGEGGIHAITPEFGRAIRRTCNRIGCPLIIDEIQSGMGRAGAFLASSLIGLRGDYYTLSKSLGGGIAKISAMLMRKSLYRKEFSLIHSSTFADDDFSCAIALKVLQMLEADDGRAYGLATERGERLTIMLQRLQAEYPDVIKEVRGRGLFIGVEFYGQDNAGSLILRGSAYGDSLGYLLAGYLLRSEGIRIVPTGSAPNVLRLEPSIYITDRDIEHLEAALARVCRFLRCQDALHLVYPLSDRSLAKPRDDIRDFRQAQDHGAVVAERPVTRPVRKVAFINHLIAPEWLRQVDPSLAELSDEALRAFVLRMEPMKKTAPYPPVRIHSPLGSAVDFILYPLCVSSEQMGRYLATGDFDAIRDDIDERIRAARGDGCEIAGLGMYTSIVTNNCTALKIPEMALTSGNALTVAMGMEAMERAAADRLGTLDGASLVVVGAAGNIASTYCALFAERLSRIVLVGSQRDGSVRRLKNTAYDIYQECWMQIAAGEDLHGIPAHLAEEELIRGWLRESRPAGEASGRAIAEYLEQRYGDDPFLSVARDLDVVREGQLVLCAANSPDPFLDARHFREGAVVCDIAVPNNVVPGLPSARPDLLYIQGGIAATPYGESLHPSARAFLGEGQLFACPGSRTTIPTARSAGSRCVKSRHWPRPTVSD
jgi:acetylornithine/succinyldiaminopimelate/putrescine aminotransferase/predicted amino acid dehydrogenase